MVDDRVQRRLAAILAADIVGYSRLMGADEVGTLARVNAIRNEILPHGHAGDQDRATALVAELTEE